MKKWACFIGLKILELCGAVLVGIAFYGVGHLFIQDTQATWYGYVVVGLTAVLLSGCVLALLLLFLFDGIPSIIRKNIEWADKLSKK
jgi:hypothetical protein